MNKLFCFFLSFGLVASSWLKVAEATSSSSHLRRSTNTSNEAPDAATTTTSKTLDLKVDNTGRKIHPRYLAKGKKNKGKKGSSKSTTKSQENEDNEASSSSLTNEKSMKTSKHSTKSSSSKSQQKLSATKGMTKNNNNQKKKKSKGEKGKNDKKQKDSTKKYSKLQQGASTSSSESEDNPTEDDPDSTSGDGSGMSSSTTTTTTMPPKPSTTTTTCTMDDRILLASSGNSGLYRHDSLNVGGTFVGNIPNNVVELVVDPMTNRAWVQVGESSFTILEINPFTGEEIPDTRFFTDTIHQFDALEVVEDGVLYGGARPRLQQQELNGEDVVAPTTGGGNDETSFIYRIDPDAGSWEVVGSTGIEQRLSGLAWTGSILYATSGGGWPSQLWTIDIETGLADIICGELPQGFDSLVYYPPTQSLYGGTPNGYIAEIDPISCSTKNSPLGNSNWWNAGYRPISGLTMACPPPPSSS